MIHLTLYQVLHHKNNNRVRTEKYYDGHSHNVELLQLLSLTISNQTQSLLQGLGYEIAFGNQLAYSSPTFEAFVP